MDFAVFDPTNPYEQTFDSLMQAQCVEDFPQDLLNDPAARPNIEMVKTMMERLPTPGGLPEALRASMLRSSHFALRDTLVRKYAWAIPNHDAVRLIARLSQDQPILEIGAGSGYWAHLIQAEGGVIKPTDLQPWAGAWTAVERMSATKAIAQTFADYAPIKPALMTVWPEYDAEWTSEALISYCSRGGDRVVYVGEGTGGCTGNDQFHEILDTYFATEKYIDIPRWEGIRDGCYVMRRNSLRWPTVY